jgi:hypothetical protein
MTERRRLPARPAPTSISILDACADPQLFGRLLRGSTWDSWKTFLATLFALPLTPEQLAIYSKHTGRTTPPSSPSHEGWLICGRRAGKSFVLALIAVWLACFKDWRPYLAPGEVGTVMIIAADRKQARVIMRYVNGLLKAVPMLAQLIEAKTRESLTLSNRIVVEVHTASFRSTRGYTVVAALLDELAYWETDELSAEPDSEVLNAIRPSMATIPGAMLLCASSPHARKGALWQAYQRHFAKDGDILVWQADTRSMNATVPQAFIDQHVQEDPARAAAEYEAVFRTDLEAFVSREAVAACVATGTYERAPQPGISYVAFCDPSGGSVDSFCCGIAHVDFTRDVTVIDALYERRPPLSPEVVVEEFSAALKRYNLITIVGDKYASVWPVEQFSKFGIVYEQSAAPKTDLYTNMLPMLNSARVELLDNPRLINQLVSLERRNTRGGRPTIDHPPGAHDDLANVVAGLVAINNKYGNYDGSYRGWSDDPDADRQAESARFQRARLANYIFGLSNGQCWPR